MTTGFGHTRIEGDTRLLGETVAGDFVVRADAEAGQIAAARNRFPATSAG